MPLCLHITTENDLNIENKETIHQLNIRIDKIKNLQNIDKFINLKKFDAYCNKDLKNIYGLEKLNKLENVNIESCNLNKIPNLPYSIKEINFYNNKITEIPDFTNYTNLVKFNICKNNIYNIYNFSNLNNISHLDLSYNPLNNIIDFKNINLPKLIKLDLSCTNINEILHIDKLTKLKILIINNNNITQIHKLPLSLTYLSCCNNNLKNLPDLSYLINLIKLFCNNNILKNIPLLPLNLKLLSCKGNYKLNNLSILPNKLESLLCANCNISELPILPNTLKYINCEFNNLKNLNKLQHCNNLIEVFVSNNNITNISGIKDKKLLYLNIIKNKLHNIPKCFYTIKTKYIYTTDLSFHNFKKYKSYINCNSLSYILNKKINYYYYKHINLYYYINYIF